MKPTCILKTPDWLARHIKSNHATLAEASNSDLPPAQQDGAAESELPPQSSPGRSITGVDLGDGQGPVLVVGPGHRPRNHHPVPLIGDNEFGLIGCQSPTTTRDAERCIRVSLPTSITHKNLSR